MRLSCKILFESGVLFECYNTRQYHINELIAIHKPDKVRKLEIMPRKQKLKPRRRMIYRAKYTVRRRSWIL